ncbi:glycosyltransferase family 4 protein [Vagococcus fluvialis]|uniref:glycosyltransferase family 4 protein n=1 Tax=Vagococcus fluvialis TaxID=2738 RepID=UPI0032E3C206
MKNVMIMCQFFYPEEVSSSLLPYQTAKKLSDNGINTSVLCGYPNEYNVRDKKEIPKKEVVNNIIIRRLKYIQLSKKGKISRLINYFSFIIAMLFNVRKTKNVDTIIVYSNPPLLPIVSLLANRLYKCKIIFVSYDVYPEIAIELEVLSQSSMISKITNRINNSLFERASQVVVLSNDMKDFYIREKQIESKKISVIENWATEEYQVVREIKSNDFKIIKDDFNLIITYLGNIGKAQDIKTIIDTIKENDIQNRKIAFIFAGRGEKKEWLLEEKNKNKLNNLFIFDYLIGSDLNDLLNISDMFIVSLEKGLSGLAVPSKTYSYYQAKKPIIAIMEESTQIFKEIKDNKCGISVENGNVIHLKNEIIKICKDKNLLNDFNVNMNKFSEKYNNGEQLNKYLKLVQEIMEEK